MSPLDVSLCYFPWIYIVLPSELQKGCAPNSSTVVLSCFKQQRAPGSCYKNHIPASYYQTSIVWKKVILTSPCFRLRMGTSLQPRVYCRTVVLQFFFKALTVCGFNETKPSLHNTCTDRWNNSLKMHDKQTNTGSARWNGYKQGGVVLYADHSSLSGCASVFTHPQKKQDTSGRRSNVYWAGIERWWGKWQSHWSLGVWWNTGDFSFHGCILQRNVHSKGAWRRQEIYTESSGPKEGCTDPAQTPPVTVRWVKCHRAFDAASPPRLS